MAHAQMMRVILFACLLAAPPAFAAEPKSDLRRPKADDILSFKPQGGEWDKKKAATMVRQHSLLRQRYDFTGEALPGAAMTNGKAVMRGPVAIFSNGFPYKPLSHPAPEPGHFVFPNFYTIIHPELERVDADFDLLDSYLPEYPPPLYLSTRPDLGDVSKGLEINLDNYKQLLGDVLSPQALEGVRIMLVPRQTLWFNKTEHRVTAKPAHGVSCFSCHVNGHTNGGILLEPAGRPNASRFRIDTPSLRGVGRARLLGFKRAIKSLQEFTEVEDYFEGEADMAHAMGALKLSREDIVAVASFLSIIDFPPNPKLGPEGRLEANAATKSELRGQELFFGKARCASCHPPPFYSDHEMHDLKVERLAGGPAEGVFKTPTLLGLKDSPPYYHDGRLPTVEDSVEFFDRVLALKLDAGEKKDLADFLRAL